MTDMNGVYHLLNESTNKPWCGAEWDGAPYAHRLGGMPLAPAGVCGDCLRAIRKVLLQVGAQIGTTLSEAKEQVKALWDEGTTCPCCGQYVRRYRRKLNADMARSLIWLYRAGKDAQEGWVDVPEKAPKHVLRNRELPRLALWRLVEAQRNNDSAKRCSGIWRVTERGVEFVHKTIDAPRMVTVFDGWIHSISDETVSIDEALENKFDYQELMYGEE